jgi:NAD+ synthase (glutamine-hydrolysing)
MRIALAQLNPISGDIDGNTRTLLSAMEEAARRGADILVAPEMVIPGYCIGDLIEDRAFLEANERAMQRVAQAARGITAVVGFIDCDYSARSATGTTRTYNAAAVVRDGHVLQRARKTLLPNYRYFDDKRFFTPADEREPVDVALPSGRARVGVSFCEDMWDDFYEV